MAVRDQDKHGTATAAATDDDAIEVEVEVEERASVPDLDLDDLDDDPFAEIDAEVEEVDDDSDDDDVVKPAAPRASQRTRLPTVRENRVPESITALNVYLARLKDVEILPIEEQAELAVRYQESGDKQAAAMLVASNLRLVVKIAFQFRRQWADVMDLIAEGNLGLAEAIRKFDADRGIPFPSYARFWIRARILAFIQENKHLIHAGSRAARKLFWRLERERRSLIADGIEPEAKRIAERVGVTEADVRELAPILDQRPVSLDVPVHGDEDGRTRGDVMADETASPEDDVSGGEIQDILQQAFGEFRETLDERDRAIWDQRLQSEDPVRLEDLGDQFGVSKERVRQLEVRIKRRLKDFLQRRLGSDVIVEALR
ncbi:MAG: RNA polymerase subunit sigma-70 [Deltaproteobacteria bacterium HGW-Deltaproteobacteria-14]|jgi:RNA polymerase sigma-32 factor|nr:MAG: RNA polymerase subunit sigma-70 [Deltaproteobacteria bacterium HGW-Deltaproteobacteria-14]